MSRIFVDLGNSRMKWGRYSPKAEMRSLAYDDLIGRDQLFDEWQGKQAMWTMASVAPERTHDLQQFLNRYTITARELTNTDVWTYLESQSMTSHIRYRDKIGIDRLLACAGGWAKRKSHHELIVITIGTAMTIDWVTKAGVHHGGCILPGPYLMAKSLNDHTAKLPLVATQESDLRVGRDTHEAIAVGIRNAIQGSITQFIAHCKAPVQLIATGGDAHYLDNFTPQPIIDPMLIIDGMRLVAGP